MAAKITRVKLKDYRSIAACDVALQSFTLLVGPNGAGKSNFLDSLRFLVHSMHAPLEQVLEVRSGIKSVLRKLPKGRISPSFSIEVEFVLEDGLPRRNRCLDRLRRPLPKAAWTRISLASKTGAPGLIHFRSPCALRIRILVPCSSRISRRQA